MGEVAGGLRWEFPLEYHVAMVCVIFATVLTFSISEPLILPVGWFFMIFKKNVDKYVFLFGHDGDLDRQLSRDDSSALFYTVDVFLLLAVSYTSIPSAIYTTPR
jgi:hypothetical protein